MKLQSLRGLFASVASVALLVGALTGPALSSAAPAAPSRVTAQAMHETLKLDQLVPVATARHIMETEGWTPVMSAYALENMKETKGILALWKHGDSGKWRILQTLPDGQTKMTAEGNGLKLRAPENLLARNASIQSTPAEKLDAAATSAPAPGKRLVQAQACADGLKEKEINEAGFSIIAEGVAEQGRALMTLALSYYADDGSNPVTWAVYYDFAGKPGMSCRIDAGFGINFEKGFDAYKPLDYPNPVIPMVPKMSG